MFAFSAAWYSDEAMSTKAMRPAHRLAARIIAKRTLTGYMLGYENQQHREKRQWHCA